LFRSSVQGFRNYLCGSLLLCVSLRYYYAKYKSYAEVGGFQMKPIGMKNFDKVQSKIIFSSVQGFRNYLCGSLLLCVSLRYCYAKHKSYAEVGGFQMKHIGMKKLR